MSQQMVIIGAGLAGLSAACTAARQGWQVWLCSSLPSERAQSVMAEGGINAALDTQGQEDSPARHGADTLRAACCRRKFLKIVLDFSYIIRYNPYCSECASEDGRLAQLARASA